LSLCEVAQASSNERYHRANFVSGHRETGSPPEEAPTPPGVETLANCPPHGVLLWARCANAIPAPPAVTPSAAAPDQNLACAGSKSTNSIPMPWSRPRRPNVSTRKVAVPNQIGRAHVCHTGELSIIQLPNSKTQKLISRPTPDRCLNAAGPSLRKLARLADIIPAAGHRGVQRR
jgi:hypothetical protein